MRPRLASRQPGPRSSLPPGRPKSCDHSHPFQSGDCVMSKSQSQHLRDEEIAGAVRRTLSHDIQLGNEDDLKVSVEDGVVLLTGTVRSAAERAAAENDARHPGVTRVDNRLTVVADEASHRDLEAD